MTQRLFISTNRLAKEWNLGALSTGVQPARRRAWRLGVAVDDVIGHVVSRCPREERRPIVGRQALPFLRHAVSVKASSHRHTRQDTDRTVLSCLVWRCELSRPTARQVRSASGCVGRRRHCRCDRRTHSGAERTCRAVGPTQFAPPDTTQTALFCRVCRGRCELGITAARLLVLRTPYR